MTAKYVYSPTDTSEPEQLEIFGTKFTAGKEVEVSDDMAIRLMGNPFFVRKDKAKDAPPAGQQAPGPDAPEPLAPGGLTPGPKAPVEPRPTEPTDKR